MTGPSRNPRAGLSADDAGGNDVDAGLANERTALAWQRTALSTAAGSAILARLTVDRLGYPALLTLGAGLVLSLWIAVESSCRYRRHASLRRQRARGGRAPAALSIAVTLIGITELAAVAMGPW